MPASPQRRKLTPSVHRVPDNESLVEAVYFGIEQCGLMWPKDLLASDDSNENGGRRWWLVYTKSRQEKCIAENLKARGTAFYLPLVEKRTRTNGRTRRSRVPLFSGYVFLFGESDDRRTALETNRVSNIAQVEDGARLKKELRQLAELLEIGVPLQIEKMPRTRETVRINAGPNRSLEGTVIRQNGTTRFAACIDCIQMGASMMLETCSIEPVPW